MSDGKSDMVEKVILEIDGDQLTDLIELPEYERTEGTENVAGQKKIVPVKNGVTTIPEIPATFKKTRGTGLFKTFLDWKKNNEVKDVVCIRTDGRGNEITRELWPNTEVKKVNSGAYDASAPTTSTFAVTFLPEDIIDIDAES